MVKDPRQMEKQHGFWSIGKSRLSFGQCSISQSITWIEEDRDS